MTIVRQYSDKDLASFKYLRLIPTVNCPTVDRIPDDPRPPLNLSRLPEEEEFIARTYGGELIASQEARDFLEEAGLTHLQFNPTALFAKNGGKEVSWNTWGAPWWHLTSDVRMPRLSPSMKRVDYRGNPLPYDHDGIISIDHGIYMPLELTYRRSDLKDLPDFDFGETFENFGSPTRHPIVSQRFREVAEEHNFPVEWAPVRIEEDE